MIDRTHRLPNTRQAQIVRISRGSVHYESEPSSDADLKLMRRIDELHLELLFAGARMLRDLLRAEGVAVGRYETVGAAREGIGRYINSYNTRRPLSSHQARTPDVVYIASLPQPSAEAA